jgi:hypothetical protein
MSKSINTISKRTEEILRLYPDTRDNDMALYVKYCEVYHTDIVHIQDMLKSTAPTFDSIGRVRRKIQETMYKPSAEAKAAKKLKEAEIRQFVSHSLETDPE